MASNLPEIFRGTFDATLVRAREDQRDVLHSSTVPPAIDPQKHFEDMFDRVNDADPSLIQQFFGGQPGAVSQSQASGRTECGHIGKFLFEVAQPGPLRESLDFAIVNDSISEEAGGSGNEGLEQLRAFVDMEKRVEEVYRLHKNRFPTQIWHCCKNLCFAKVACDPQQYMVFTELVMVHEHAEGCHAATEMASSLTERRGHGIGTSTVAFVAPSRAEREAASGEQQHVTERRRTLREFGAFVMEVMPFLYGQIASPRSSARLNNKLCTQAICCLLGVSRNFLYNRTSMLNPENATEDELTSLIDTAGVRLRQLRRKGDRRNYPSLQSLQSYECGCDTPCFAGVPQLTLVSEYDQFIKLAQELRPRHRENRFLLNRMFCPLTNTTTRVCNRSISALYTVSESLISDVRRVLNVMCNDPSLPDRPLLCDASTRYRYDRGHPLNRYPDSVRNKVERQLDMVLRADPAGSSGESVCRVYSPEINTQDKLRKVLRLALDMEDSTEAELSSSTLQRMVKDYLKRRNYSTIAFTQSDHNACPNCKTLHYAVLQYHHERMYLQREFDKLSRSFPLQACDQQRYNVLSKEIEAKGFQEEECLKELRVHNARDARIRAYVKKLSDHCRKVEVQYQRLQSSRSQRLDFYSTESVEWNLFADRACITHQDDMSKLDLPHFVVSASSDITRWRFDVNAHCSSVTNDAIVLSHEQGTGSKNASAIVEEIILSHLLSCRGESIKVIVSDNASVGKNWMTTVALPQYLVDQGLATICMVIYLENNHGKWLCDMLFGQFQSRRRREVLFSMDDMLNGFEDVNRKSGKAQGFAINPLSAIDFAEVFQSLGYETTPPSEFGFVKRNIHFAAACAAGAKQRLPVELRELLQDALPDDPGMVRISTEPPTDPPQCQRRYEDCYFDVPAARLTSSEREDVHISVRTESLETDDADCAPLVVPLDMPYAPSGKGVVSTRTAEHVGYNGLSFRRLAACPEMRDISKPLVSRSWPRGLIDPSVGESASYEPGSGTESLKCAPLNWIVRRTVRHFCDSESDWKARYPPRNLLNARFRKGPRVAEPWIPTATYTEPPFPICEGTAACSAMKRLAAENNDISRSVHVLDALKAIFREMGDRDGVLDPWLQRRVTVPSRRTILRYREDIRMHVERESGHPPAPKTLRQVFKEDDNILAKADSILSHHSVSGQTAKALKAKTLAELFQEAENTPGGMDRFYPLVEKDQERYSKELKEFKKKQEDYDKDHGLFPLQ